MKYRFDNEQTAFKAEDKLCKLASKVGMEFKGVTKRWDIPQPERHPLPPDAAWDDIGEPTGYWTFARLPEDVLERIPLTLALEWLNEFQPEIIE